MAQRHSERQDSCLEKGPKGARNGSKSRKSTRVRPDFHGFSLIFLDFHGFFSWILHDLSGKSKVKGSKASPWRPPGSRRGAGSSRRPRSRGRPWRRWASAPKRAFGGSPRRRRGRSSPPACRGRVLTIPSCQQSEHSLVHQPSQPISPKP